RGSTDGIAWSPPGRMGNEYGILRQGGQSNRRSGRPIMRGKPIPTVLVGPSALLREGLARTLLTAGFRIIASESTFDNLDLSSLSKYPSILLVLDTGDRPEAAGAQVE